MTPSNVRLMQQELVHLDVDEGVARITLDSPHNRNALSRQLITELHASLDDIDGAHLGEIRAVVLGHAGPVFCSGADLKERSAPAASDGDEHPGTSMSIVMSRLIDMPRPTIAAVRGPVRAGGIGLMASCDLIVVDRSVDFALTEVRIGVAAAIISVPILRRVPPGKIAAAMLTGEKFDAEAAVDMGLATHASDDVDATVDQLCDGIRAGAPRAVAETKRILGHVPGLPRDAAFDEMQELSDRLFNGPDAAEGMAAFREKRPPRWA